MTKITLQRLFDTGDDTVGRLYLNDVALCWTLEDTYRPEKIKHKTRIPSGTYKLIFRKYGRFYDKFKKRFSDVKNDRGMLQLENVPNYSDILIHTGNTDEDTSGCILLGSEVREDNGDWRLVDSTSAYRKVYGIVAGLLENDTVVIEIKDERDIDIDIEALGLDEIIKKLG